MFKIADSIEYFLRLIIGQTIVGTDDCRADFVLEHMSLGVNEEDAGKRQFVLVRSERAYVVGELFGEHWDGSVHEVHGGAAVVGFVVHVSLG